MEVYIRKTSISCPSLVNYLLERHEHVHERFAPDVDKLTQGLFVLPEPFEAVILSRSPAHEEMIRKAWRECEEALLNKEIWQWRQVPDGMKFSTSKPGKENDLEEQSEQDPLPDGWSGNRHNLPSTSCLLSRVALSYVTLATESRILSGGQDERYAARTRAR